MRAKTKINTESISATKPFDRLRQFTSKLMSVPKTEIDRREAEYKQARKAEHGIKKHS